MSAICALFTASINWHFIRAFEWWATHCFKWKIWNWWHLWKTFYLSDLDLLFILIQEPIEWNPRLIFFSFSQLIQNLKSKLHSSFFFHALFYSIAFGNPASINIKIKHALVPNISSFFYFVLRPFLATYSHSPHTGKCILF